MNNKNNPLETALVDVRKAYRLLHDYQRMILDAVDYIGKKLGMTYSGGSPRYSDPAPRRNGGKLGCWAWDWLNMVCYAFDFIKKVDEEEVRFSVLLVSDTGYFESEDESGKKLDTKTYLNANTSNSKLVLLTTSNKWKFPYTHTKSLMKDLIKSGTLPDEFGDAGMIASTYDVSCLADIDSVNEMIDEFLAKAQAKGAKLSRVK